MARLAYDTVREMMAAAPFDIDEPDARPGMLAVIQTFSSSLKWNPHIHAIGSRGVWAPDGEWMPVPYVDEHRAELLFRHKQNYREPIRPDDDDKPTPSRRAANKRWAELIYRIPSNARLPVTIS